MTSAAQPTRPNRRAESAHGRFEAGPLSAALPLPPGGSPPSESERRSAVATEPSASSPCGRASPDRRQPLPARGHRQIAAPNARVRARTAMPTAPAAHSGATRRQPSTANRCPAPPSPFLDESRPGNPKAQRRTCPRTPPPTPTPTRSHATDLRLRARDLRQRRPPPLLCHRRRRRPLLTRRGCGGGRGVPLRFHPAEPVLG